MLTSHLVVFVLRIKPSLYPLALSRHGSQTITRSFFRMVVHASSFTGRVPKEVDHFNYTDPQLSSPFRALRPHHNTHCASAFYQCLPCFPGGSEASPVSRFDEVPYIVSCLRERTLRIISASNFNLSQL